MVAVKALGKVLDVPSIGGAATVLRLRNVCLAANVGVLVLVANVEAKVVDHVAGLFVDVGSLLRITDGRVAADVLKGSHVVGVGRSRQTREDADLGEEEGSGADGQEGALSGRILLLQLRVGLDQGKRLRLALERGIGVTADDDHDVEVIEALMGLFVCDLGINNDALLRQDLALGAGYGAFESLRCYKVEKLQVSICVCTHVCRFPSRSK